MNAPMRPIRVPIASGDRSVSGLPSLGRHVSFEAVRDFVSVASETDDMASLRETVGETTRELGFDYFAIIHHIRFGRPTTDKVRLSNYPIEWIAKLREDEQFGTRASRRRACADRLPVGQWTAMFRLESSSATTCAVQSITASRKAIPCPIMSRVRRSAPPISP